MDFTQFFQLIFVVILAGVAYLVLDQYKWWRDRRVEGWRKEGILPPPELVEEPNLTSKGELSTAAKYAIWNYMFSLLAVGGTVIGILSGIAGYMIKDLATEKAIQTALNEMQKPLSSQMDKFADANAALKVAVERINDSKTFPKAVADDLVARYPDKLRGERGADGKNGADGLPGKDGPSVADVVAALMKSHASELRGKDGSNGKDGANGKDGKDGLPGKDGPSAAEVAAVLVKSYSTELRGKDGSNGRDGANGKDGKDGLPGKDGPGAAEVAAVLMKSYAAELRGKDGINGKDGVDGKDGKDGLPGKDGVNGRDGVRPELGEIAELVVKQYNDQLRGPPGKDGTSGTNGQSPSAAEVAGALWERHRDEIRQRGNRKQSR